MHGARRKISRHADVAKAMDYMLRCWDTFSRFLGDDRICLTNNAAERALRGVALRSRLMLAQVLINEPWYYSWLLL